MDVVPGWWVGATTVVPRTILFALASRVGGWRALVDVPPEDLVPLGLGRDHARAWARCGPLRTRGTAITRVDPRYPSGLEADEQAPPVLFVEGDPALLAAEDAVGVVGTRACSARGFAFARELGRRLAAGGQVVVSGLARGIDAAAHAGALAAGGGRTIAVLGHGLAHQSPRSNARLRERIVCDGGLVLSGWPDSVAPERWTFPKRNRWIAGLSRSLVVVEGDVRSGALITARDARELGRTVWAVPGPPGEPTSAGPLALIEEQRQRDIHMLDMTRLRLAELLEGRGEVPAAVRSAAQNVLSQHGEGRVRVLTSIPELLGEVGVGAPPQLDWVDQLVAGARLEEVASRRGTSVLALQSELVRRELAGELVRTSNGRYARPCSRSQKSS